MNVDTPLVRSLRDHLVGLGRASIAAQHGGTPAALGSPDEAAVMERFRPYAELLFLIAAADGSIDRQERLVMLGAFRALTGGRVRGKTLEALEEELRAALTLDGVEGRLEFVCSALANDKKDAEMAFTLAAAVALADQELEGGEVSLLKQLASWMGISEKRANILVDAGRQSIPPK